MVGVSVGETTGLSVKVSVIVGESDQVRVGVWLRVGLTVGVPNTVNGEKIRPPVTAVPSVQILNGAEALLGNGTSLNPMV